MMKILPVLALSMSLIACNSGSNKSSDSHGHSHQEGHDHDHSQDEVAEETESVYDNASTTIGFGAFKTTDKKEVKGWFSDFEMIGITESKDLAEIFGNASVIIQVGSLDTKDQGRNATLLAEFFNNTTSNETITGKVISFNTDSATAVLELTFNDATTALTFGYSLNGDTLSMQSVLDLEQVNGLGALASLNTACESLHKGSDGVSKTWNDVNIYLTTILKR
ncbi:MAG: polyisoprenoid-binding protein YceI [Saprospiraceae bacterium]|jgi:polyisoprenoid-binding protein YceI